MNDFERVAEVVSSALMELTLSVRETPAALKDSDCALVSEKVFLSGLAKLGRAYAYAGGLGRTLASTPPAAPRVNMLPVIQLDHSEAALFSAFAERVRSTPIPAATKGGPSVVEAMYALLNLFSVESGIACCFSAPSMVCCDRQAVLRLRLVRLLQFLQVSVIPLLTLSGPLTEDSKKTLLISLSAFFDFDAVVR